MTPIASIAGNEPIRSVPARLKICQTFSNISSPCGLFFAFRFRFRFLRDSTRHGGCNRPIGCTGIFELTHHAPIRSSAAGFRSAQSATRPLEFRWADGTAAGRVPARVLWDFITVDALILRRSGCGDRPGVDRDCFLFFLSKRRDSIPSPHENFFFEHGPAWRSQ
jgi:hypothetical protein